MMKSESLIVTSKEISRGRKAENRHKRSPSQNCLPRRFSCVLGGLMRNHPLRAAPIQLNS